ncbi:uncharacterized protein LOC132264355 isoform X2 [Phlebotomus argentipes]|uniref:uncharacterized protein LOC132264355 isoform X2 n=1 Tax=Phlebotomus argentipes TaxID=94469 RepID=UPI0028930EEB|nr:uncharacterized protein LOC132264355 isoform X2 [Phlebotomus argentipes]
MSMPSTSSVAGGPPDTNRQLFSVKQERHDEAEILELAAKMMESHKAQMTKAAQQQAMQQQMRSVNVINSTGQTNILSYFQRKSSQQGSSSLHAAGTSSASIVPASTPATAAVATTNGGSYANGKQANGDSTASASPDGEKKACDEESQKGHFGWHTFNKSIYIPYILRSGEKYCAVRIVESKLLNKYLNYLHHDIYSCTCVRSYYITEAEGRLLNEINHKHSESHYGRDMFTVKDLVVRLSDVSKFWTFLDVCYKKLLMGNNNQGQSEKCGFIRINKESVVPYTVRDGQKFVPLFYFEGETENLKLKADNLSGWDLSYLKFCCKVQGIRNELFASDKVAVISLTDIKSYFPPGTQFEDYWPSKVVDTQLLVQKSNANSSVHWTRQPSAPPPKSAATAQAKSAPARKQAASAVSYGNAAAMQQQVNMQQRLPGQMGNTNNPVVSNVWPNLAGVSGLNLTPGQEQMLRMAQAAQQVQSQRGYPTTRSQVQNIMQRQPYNVNFPPVATAMSAMTGLTSTANQVPPPLIRGAQQAPTSHHMSSCVTGPPSLRSSNSLTINPVATPSHLLPPPPPYNASSNHLHEYLLANVSLASSPKSSPYGSGGGGGAGVKPSYSAAAAFNNNNSDFLLDNNILSAIYSKTPITSTANLPVGSPARASPNQSSAMATAMVNNGQTKHPPPPLIPMPGTNSADAFSSIRDTLQQLRNLKSLTTTFLPQNIPIPDPYGSPSPSHVAGATSPFSHHPLSMAPAANPISNPAASLANRQTKSVTMSATDVIDLSSPPRSAASLLHHQQQQHQQQQLHQQQQRSQQMLTNGRCSSAASAQSMMHGGVPSATSAAAAAQVAAMQQHQRQSSVDASRLSAIPEMASHNGNVPYRMQKAQIDGCTVPCINMKAYSHSDLLMTLADLKDIFFPHMTLENCRKVLDVLNVELYKGNRSQLKVFQEYGHHGMENMALVLVRDIVNFMPQLKYMVRSQPQEQPAHKRARIS